MVLDPAAPDPVEPPRMALDLAVGLMALYRVVLLRMVPDPAASPRAFPLTALARRLSRLAMLPMVLVSATLASINLSLVQKPTFRAHRNPIVREMGEGYEKVYHGIKSFPQAKKPPSYVRNIWAFAIIPVVNITVVSACLVSIIVYFMLSASSLQLRTTASCQI